MGLKRNYLYCIIYSAAIILLLGFVVYALIDQSIFADALVDSFIE